MNHLLYRTAGLISISGDNCSFLLLQTSYILMTYASLNLEHGTLSSDSRLTTHDSRFIEPGTSNSSPCFIYVLIKQVVKFTVYTSFENNRLRTNRIYKILAGYILLFCLLPICHAQGTKEYMRQGNTFLRSKNYEQAVGQFDQALKLQPDLVKAYLGRAAAYDSLRMFGNAAADYDSAAMYLTGRAEVYYSAGRCYYRMDMPEKAIQRLGKAVGIKKNYRQAYRLMAVLFTEIKKYDEALEAWTKVLEMKGTSFAYFRRGQVNEILGKYDEAKQDYSNALSSDKSNKNILCALASVGLQLGDTSLAINNTRRILEKDHQNICALVVRSKIYALQNNLEVAVGEISRCLAIAPGNEELYFTRALYYRFMNRPEDAVSDLSQIIAINPGHVQALYNRALIFESTGNYQAAADDYRTVLKLSDSETVPSALITEVNTRLFDLRRETNRPEIHLFSPVPDEKGQVTLPGGTDSITISGEILDESGIAFLKVNDQEWMFNDTTGKEVFEARVSLAGEGSLTLQASDIFSNNTRQDYPLIFTETTPPVIYMIAPYATEDNQISLYDNNTLLEMEGYVEDQSLIRSISINGMPADYMPGEIDPTFTAGINIAGLDEIIVAATDAYGNTATEHYRLKRETASLSADNPMGSTWVVIIENSSNLNYPDVKGPRKEVAQLKTTLARYQIHSVIHEKNLTKAELEKFFSIELRDLVRSNEVVSLVIWFAGQGISLNNTGYWLPSDAVPANEYSYYNLNALKASLYSYVSQVRHLLIICGGSNPGLSFYRPAERDSLTAGCEDAGLTANRSAQILTTTGEPSVTDNSFFNTSVTGVLVGNTDNCMPVERIVPYVGNKLKQSDHLQPVLGIIEGLSDEKGSFFFVRKK